MAFLSSRIQETESKLFSATGASVEFGGVTDIETRGVSGIGGQVGMQFQIAQQMWYGVESGSLCIILTERKICI